MTDIEKIKPRLLCQIEALKKMLLIVNEYFPELADEEKKGIVVEIAKLLPLFRTIELPE